MTSVAMGTVLHTVFGRAGSYEETEEWAVASYVDRAKAEEHMKLAQAWREDWAQRFEEDYDWAIMDEVCPFDAFKPSNRDVRYYVGLTFVHHDPAAYAQESAVMIDYAKAHGWLT